MNCIKQKQLARILIENDWEVLTYCGDYRFGMENEYRLLSSMEFEAWWEDEKEDKVWFRNQTDESLKIKFDYERISIWKKGESSSITFRREIPIGELSGLIDGGF